MQGRHAMRVLHRRRPSRLHIQLKLLQHKLGGPLKVQSDGTLSVQGLDLQMVAVSTTPLSSSCLHSLAIMPAPLPPQSYEAPSPETWRP